MSSNPRSTMSLTLEDQLWLNQYIKLKDEIITRIKAITEINQMTLIIFGTVLGVAFALGKDGPNANFTNTPNIPLLLLYPFFAFFSTLLYLGNRIAIYRIADYIRDKVECNEWWEHNTEFHLKVYNRFRITAAICLFFGTPSVSLFLFWCCGPLRGLSWVGPKRELFWGLCIAALFTFANLIMIIIFEIFSRKGSFQGYALKISAWVKKLFLHQELIPPGGSGNPITSVEPAITRNIVPFKHMSSPLWMYSAIVGNGRVLACLDETGSIAQLFYPFIDAGPHVRTYLTGIQIKQTSSPQTSESEKQTSNRHKVSWFNEEDWQHTLSYIESTAAVKVSSFNKNMNILIERTIAVHPENGVLITRIKLKNCNKNSIQCKLVSLVDMNIYNQLSNNCCFFDQGAKALVFFAANCYIGLKSDMYVIAFSCEKYDVAEPEKIFRDATNGVYSGSEYALGQISSTICHNFGTIDAECSSEHSTILCFRQSLEDVLAFSMSQQEAVENIENTINWWRQRYNQLQLAGGSEVVQKLYNRSLITLSLLTDSNSMSTGGIIAAPECDPDFRASGGYGMCWPRDGAYNAFTLDLLGRHEHARKFYQWALQVQSSSGFWYQRYFVNGNVAPTWGLMQFDEIGSVVWAMCQHVFLTGDMNYGKQIFPQLLHTCEYMHRSLDAETGLAPITKDLWEDHDSISTYACASTWGAFDAFSQLAQKLSIVVKDNYYKQQEDFYKRVADKLKTAIEFHLWDSTKRYFLRGIKLKTYNVHPRHKLAKDYWTTTVLQQSSYLPDDPVVEISTLALCVPFGVFQPNDPRMEATAKLIEEKLTSPIGGILRYQGDNYRGGKNPWIICTLWLAWYDLLAGKQEQALNLYRWVMNHCTELHLLPEQVDHKTGKPCWVVPLGWSHAMFLLVTHLLAEKKLLP